MIEEDNHPTNCYKSNLLYMQGRKPANDSDMTRQGCMRIPKKLMLNAALAGLGGNGENVYGHIRGLKGAVDSSGTVENSGNQLSMDERAMIEQIERDVISLHGAISFDDIIGLDASKQVLRETVVLPYILPELFQGLRRPWKGILLYGPPGTGKTMLAKAVASLGGFTFINCSASLLMNKYLGESEKMIRCIFDLAKSRSPSVLFFDEIDSVMVTAQSSSIGRKGPRPPKHHSNDISEATRRFRSELLIQLDSLPLDTSHLVHVIAASNFPWDLDEALIRRLEKRILVGLPNLNEREMMIQANLGIQVAGAGLATNGFSPSDIKSVCREAAMIPVRRLLSQHFNGNLKSTCQEIANTFEQNESVLEVEDEDLWQAIRNQTKTVTSETMEMHSSWAGDFGSL